MVRHTNAHESERYRTKLFDAQVVSQSLRGQRCQLRARDAREARLVRLQRWDTADPQRNIRTRPAAKSAEQRGWDRSRSRGLTEECAVKKVIPILARAQRGGRMELETKEPSQAGFERL